ncbi:MAG TPA: nucleotidyltransferase family protein, partial [Clostridia bacterium]|nr:nucleotidyltransferase family protein [Clostridia bacterium]
GIVAEYNPFHSGHEYQIQTIRESGCTHIVAVMSGNFTQRGEPACIRKEARCRAALQCGVDLVLELPLPWSTASAETFASGAVTLLDALGCVDLLSFGSECGDILALTVCAKAALAVTGQPEFKDLLKKGLSFPKARELAMRQLTDIDLSPLSSPNDTLAVEYIKAIIQTGSKMAPMAVRRAAVGHDSEIPGGRFASASLIRKLLQTGKNSEGLNYVPQPAREIYLRELESRHAPIDLRRAGSLVLSQLRRMSPADFSALPDVSEGLENRIFQSVSRAASLEELYSLIKTKRYTHSRIRRVILSAFLGINRSHTSRPVPYIRVLGFSRAGTGLLRQIKTSAALPIVMRHADIAALDPFAQNIYRLECQATDQYSLCLPCPQPCGMDQRLSAIRNF